MQKPEVDFHPEPAPKDLVVRDIVVGDGAEAQPGGRVTVHYVGVNYETGEQFDASWDRGEAATFPLGSLIPAWQQGIPGMKVGGRRELICPPHTAYGNQGRLAGQTLIFIIDLLQAG